MKTNLFSFLKKHLATVTLAGALIAGGNVTAQTQRVYANVQQTQNSGVTVATYSSAGSAADNSAQTASTINVTASVLGAATQYIQFTDGSGHTIDESGKQIHVKIGVPNGLLSLLSGVTISGFTNLHQSLGSWTATATGTAYTGSTLLGLLNGTGTADIIINAPSGSSTTGVYVQMSGVAIVGQSMSVYGAYVLNGSSVGCPEPEDVLSGVSDVLSGVSAASILGAVTNPYNAIDADPTNSTYAQMSSLINVANGEYLTAMLNTTAKAGDSVKVVLGTSTGLDLLNLGVLNNLQIQAYQDNTPVGSPLTLDKSLLTLQLLPSAGNVYIATFVPTASGVSQAFNRVEVSRVSVASASDLLGNGIIDVYNIGIRIAAPVVSPTGNTANQYVYTGNATTLKATANAAGDAIVWIDSTSGSTVSNGSIPSTKPAGQYIYYALSSRDNCTALSDTAKLVLHVVTAPTNTPVSGNVGQPYSSDVKITTAPSGLPNTPHYVYSLGTGTVFNFTNSMNTYAFNSRAFRSGPAAPEMAPSALDVSGLPPGLTLNNDGTITGTPIDAGDYDFSVHVEDDANQDPLGNNLVVGDFDKSISIQAALPIQIQPGSFKASLDNSKNVVLSWATSSEINSSEFNILRSSDNQNFASVGSVNAKGNSSAEQTYSFTDKTAAGLVYYKLQEVDVDHTVGYTSGVISIDNGKQSNLLISPNPATTYININGNTGSVKVYDAAGRLVLTGQGAQIDVRSLSSGVYYLLIHQDNGTIVKRSFIKK